MDIRSWKPSSVFDQSDNDSSYNKTEVEDLKYLLLIPLFLIVLPAFAQTTDPTSQFMPSSSAVQDVYHTLIDKISSGPNNDGSLSNIGNQTKQVIDSSLTTTNSIRLLVGSIFGWVALKFFGKELPNWFVPLIGVVATLLIIVGFWRHLIRILITGVIIGVVIFILLILGGQFIP